MKPSLRFPLLALLLLPLVALSTPSAGADPGPLEPSALVLDKDDEAVLEAAIKNLRKASGRDDLDERMQTLDKVVSLGNPDALGELTLRLGLALDAAAKAEKELEDDRIMLDRRRVQLAELELRMERNPDLRPQVNGFKNEVALLEKEVAKGEAAVALEVPWRDALRAGAKDLLLSIGENKRRGIVKGIWKDFEDGSSKRQRLASAWLLLDLSDSGTTERFAKVMVEVLDEHRLLKRELPELMAELRKHEARIRADTEKTDGRVYQSTLNDYEQVLAEVTALNDQLLELSRFADDLQACAAQAISSEEEPDEAIGDVLKMSRKSPFQVELIGVLRLSGHDQAPALLMKELDRAKEGFHKQLIVEALAELDAGAEAERWMLTEGLTDDDWNVRSAVVRALAKLRSKDAIPALIDRIEAENGRVRTDIGEALKSLTGRNFRSNVDQWRNWWEQNADGFVVSEELPKSSEEEALENVGMTFFGLRSESQKVLFVLDVSGSMAEPMRSYVGSKDESGETRISVAKRELLQALAGIREGGTFNIMMYSNDVWSWSDEPVVMNEETRAEATEFVEGLEVQGGTNLYGAVIGGLDACRGGARRKDIGSPKWVSPMYDTVFILSDGAPSVGVSTDRDDILDMAAEENSDMSVTVNTVGLSAAQDAILMRRLAEQTGGTYVAR